jgi:hypothetical protein
MGITRSFLMFAIIVGLGKAGGQAAGSALLGTQSTQPSKPRFSLTISTPKNVVTSGSDVIVKIVLTNTTDKPIYIYYSMSKDPGELDYSMTVRNEKGELAPQTEHGRKVKGYDSTPPIAMSINEIAVSVEPGQTTGGQINVTKLHNLSQPGKYTIRIERWDQENKAWAESNTLVVTVIP